MPKAITLYNSSSRLRRDPAEPLYVRLWGRATALLADSDEPVPLDGWVEAALDNGLTCLLPVLAALPDPRAPGCASPPDGDLVRGSRSCGPTDGRSTARLFMHRRPRGKCPDLPRSALWTVADGWRSQY